MAPFRSIIPKPNDSTETLADWIELEAIRSENGVGSLRELAQAVTIAGTKDSDDVAPDDKVSVDEFAHVIAEIEDRASSVGNEGYPFEIDASGASISLRKDWHKSTYCYLLLLTQLDARSFFLVRRKKYFHARLFEALATVTAQNYLGGHANYAEAFRFGWPRPSRTSFRQALDELAKATGGEVLNYVLPKWEKDERLDVFAWRRFPDGRCNRMAIFGQCAGGADWDVKGPQPQRFLGTWLKLHAPSPWPVLFVPRMLSDDDFVKEGQVSLIFDRCRIASLVTTIDAPELQNDGFEHWMNRALHEFGSRAARA